jgi:hypothetical protein
MLAFELVCQQANGSTGWPMAEYLKQKWWAIRRVLFPLRQPLYKHGVRVLGSYALAPGAQCNCPRVLPCSKEGLFSLSMLSFINQTDTAPKQKAGTRRGSATEAATSSTQLAKHVRHRLCSTSAEHTERLRHDSTSVSILTITRQIAFAFSMSRLCYE